MKRTPCIVVCSALMGVSGLFAQPQTVPSQPVTVVPVVTAGAATGVTAAVVTAANVTPPTLPPAARPGTAAEARLVNLSTRARVTASNVLITGFAINGDSSRTLLVRAAGPGLAAFGVAGTLASPRLELRGADGALVTVNAGWADSPALATAFAQAGAFPFAPGSADAAAVVTLAPGSYTVQVQDAAGHGGVTLAEIYDLSPPGDSRLVNVSTRTTVAPSGGELISGFVLAGTGPREFLLRGVGPGLEKFGVSGTLTDPLLALYDTAGQQLAANDNWSGRLSVGATSGTAATITSAIVAAAVVSVVPFPSLAVQTAAASITGARVSSASNATGAFGLDLLSNDAALVASLMPGAYTVQVAGAGITVPTVVQVSGPGSSSGTTAETPSVRVAAIPGVALLEIYELP
jgi:hypothetical protein